MSELLNNPAQQQDGARSVLAHAQLLRVMLSIPSSPVRRETILLTHSTPLFHATTAVISQSAAQRGMYEEKTDSRLPGRTVFLERILLEQTLGKCKEYEEQV